MAIIGWPNDIPTQTAIPCVVCGQEKQLEELSVGLRTIGGEQAFACDIHFCSGKFIVGWANFRVHQQQAATENDIQKIANSYE